MIILTPGDGNLGMIHSVNGDLGILNSVDPVMIYSIEDDLGTILSVEGDHEIIQSIHFLCHKV